MMIPGGENHPKASENEIMYTIQYHECAGKDEDMISNLSVCGPIREDGIRTSVVERKQFTEVNVYLVLYSSESGWNKYPFSEFERVHVTLATNSCSNYLITSTQKCYGGLGIKCSNFKTAW